MESIMEPWKTLDRKTLLTVDDGRFLTVEAHTVELPCGRVIENWPWVVTPDFVNIVARTPQNQFICFRQTKYATPGVSLATVGGYVDEGEDPLEAAKRELLEETGYRAPTWIALGSYAVDGNRGAGNAHLFLADDAVWSQPSENDDLEQQELLLLSHAEIVQALCAGDFRVVTWAAAVSLAMVYLNT
jgi:ADP-ribose pyrophosphatase